MTEINSAAEGKNTDMTYGTIVQSVMGRDKKHVYMIVGFREMKSGQNYVLISDGDRRKFDSPKIKNPKHLKVLKLCDEGDLKTLTDEYIRLKLHDIDPLYKG